MKKPKRGEYHWQIEHQDNTITNKEDDDGTRHHYHFEDAKINRHNIKHFALINDTGNIVTQLLNVPSDAQVFQRRRSIDIRKGSDTFDHVYLIGWRRRLTETTVEVKLKAVYPDGKVTDHSKFGDEPWLYEPEWFSEEQV